MKKVSTEQQKRLEEVMKRLREAWSELESTSEVFEDVATKAFEAVGEKANAYNALVGEANELIDDVREQINSYIDEQSDEWQKSGAGEAYGYWAADWVEEIDMVELKPELTLLDQYEGPPDLDDGLSYSFEPDLD